MEGLLRIQSGQIEHHLEDRHAFGTGRHLRGKTLGHEYGTSCRAVYSPGKK